METPETIRTDRWSIQVLQRLEGAAAQMRDAVNDLSSIRAETDADVLDAHDPNGDLMEQLVTMLGTLSTETAVYVGEINRLTVRTRGAVLMGHISESVTRARADLDRSFGFADPEDSAAGDGS